MSEKKKSPAVVLTGLALAGAGVTHFVAPQLFEPITKPAFPRDTDRHIKVNGSIETALGIGLLIPKTRKLAKFGALGYVGYLAANAIRHR
ncbi:hypothetical protein QN239_28590 [Mycolicibacterium sp. Y3]